METINVFHNIFVDFSKCKFLPVGLNFTYTDGLVFVASFQVLT